MPFRIRDSLYNFIDFYGKAKKRSAIIRNNRNYLVANIELTDELLASLLSLNCITQEQSRFIQRQHSTRYKNDELLNVMETVDETNFSKFVKCLRRTNQKTVAKIVECGGGSKYKLYLLASYLCIYFFATPLKLAGCPPLRSTTIRSRI